MKRFVVIFGFVVVVMTLFVALKLHTEHTAALSTPTCFWGSPSACGYYNGANHEGANCNVLPSGNSSSWCQAGDTSKLLGVTTAPAFISTVTTYLNDNGASGIDVNSRIGAAFLIDFMLGIDYNNGSPGNGVNDARSPANYNKWVSEVNALAVNFCTAPSMTPTCPGMSFGINWNYTPSLSAFCRTTGPTFNTGYDQFKDDAVLYPVANGWAGLPMGSDSTNPPRIGCEDAYEDMQPEIVFYWNNGANSFSIGTRCGNVVQTYSAPPFNNPPTGHFDGPTCNYATGMQTISNVWISDPDAPTTGYVAVSGSSWTYPVRSGTTYSTISIPVSVGPPYTPVTISLYAVDTGPLGSQQPVLVYPPSPIYSVTPCATIGCSLSVSPVGLDPYTKFSVALTVTNSVNQNPPGGATLTIMPPSGGGYAYSGSQGIPAGNSSSVTITFANLGPPGAAGLFRMTGTVSVDGINTTCSGTFPVVYLPYLNVYGGDVKAGSSPSYNGTASTCSIDPSGATGVTSWNNRAPLNYSGAGSEYAVQTLGQIQDFASSLNPANNTPPAGLSFANSGLTGSQFNPGAGLFGGYYGAVGSNCDFTSDLSGSGVHVATADTTFAATTVATGTTDIWWVKNANVYISGNIAYAGTAGWANLSAIPYFKVVVTGGNIYIDSSVAQLDGTYVAEPNGGSGGVIYTCAKSIGVPWNPPTDYNAGYYAACNKQLMINGSFVAKQVQFGRTFGSVGQARSGDSLTSNHDAEVFNYTPEEWLPRYTNTPTNKYDSIMALPPVL